MKGNNSVEYLQWWCNKNKNLNLSLGRLFDLYWFSRPSYSCCGSGLCRGCPLFCPALYTYILWWWALNAAELNVIWTAGRLLSVWHSAGDSTDSSVLRRVHKRGNKLRRCNTWGLIKTVVIVPGMNLSMAVSYLHTNKPSTHNKKHIFLFLSAPLSVRQTS